MDYSNEIIQGIMAARDKEKIGVRWPLKKAIIYLHKDNEKTANETKKLTELILKQTNLKKIEFIVTDKTLDEEVNGVLFKFGHIVLDTTITKELEEEGYCRELMRRIQDLRKKNNLQKEDKINLDISLDLNLTKFMDEIKKRTGVKKLSFNKSKYNIILNGNIKDKNFEISFEKV